MIKIIILCKTVPFPTTNSHGYFPRNNFKGLNSKHVRKIDRKKQIGRPNVSFVNPQCGGSPQIGPYRILNGSSHTKALGHMREILDGRMYLSCPFDLIQRF